MFGCTLEMVGRLYHWVSQLRLSSFGLSEHPIRIVASTLGFNSEIGFLIVHPEVFVAQFKKI